MRDQKGFTQIVVVAVILVVLLAAVFYLVRRGSISTNPASLVGNQTSTPKENGASQASVPTVNNSQDLTTVSNDLDNTNINDLNTQLSQNDSDAASF